MTDREQPEALRLADWLDGNSRWPSYVPQEAAAELRRLHQENRALRDRLAQPEREPVKYAATKSPMIPDSVFSTNASVYTAPPKREWVGLTDDEIEEAYQLSLAKYIEEVDPDYHSQSSMADYVFVRAIEAKLKEKNT
jgi:hypothetical protein